jgi:hypothetical protein
VVDSVYFHISIVVILNIMARSVNWYPVGSVLSVNLKQYFADSSTIIPVLFLLVCAYWFWSNSAQEIQPRSSAVEVSSLSTAVQLSRVRESALDTSLLSFETPELEREIQSLLVKNQFKEANTRLLEMAADAVEAGEDRRLANILLLLGSAAIDSQQLNSAELLLQEALEIARRENDRVAMAKTYQQLGRLNITARALARYAAESYDRLWIARSQIFKGDYRSAEENLNKVIAATTEIRRYGAAAEALETLAEFKQKFHDNYQAQIAIAEAARLYATSGQLSRARALVENLESSGYDPSQLDFLGREVETLFRRYEQDQLQVSQAQDLNMLYHHYRSQGDHQRAWQLRIKASRLLGRTSETAVFERRADVLAILYNSNFAMDRAEQYLNQADSLFSGFGAEDKAIQAQIMRSLIY